MFTSTVYVTPQLDIILYSRTQKQEKTIIFSLLNSEYFMKIQGIGGMTHEQMSHEEIEQPSMSMSMSNSNGPTATGGALDCLIMSNSPSPSPPSHLFQPQDLDLTTNAAFFQVKLISSFSEN